MRRYRRMLLTCTNTLMEANNIDAFAGLSEAWQWWMEDYMYHCWSDEMNFSAEEIDRGLGWLVEEGIISAEAAQAVRERIALVVQQELRDDSDVEAEYREYRARQDGYIDWHPDIDSLIPPVNNVNAPIAATDDENV